MGLELEEVAYLIIFIRNIFESKSEKTAWLFFIIDIGRQIFILGHPYLNNGIDNNFCIKIL